MCQECKIDHSFFGPFFFFSSELCLQGAILRDEVMSPCRTKNRLCLLLTIKHSRFRAQHSSPIMKTILCSSMHLGPICFVPGGIRVQRPGINMPTLWLLLSLWIVRWCSVNIDKTVKDNIFGLQSRIKSDSSQFASLDGAPVCVRFNSPQRRFSFLQRGC